MSKIIISEGYTVWKKLVATAIEDHIAAIGKTDGKLIFDGSLDSRSSMLVEYLASIFSKFKWYKNSSQRPFDIFSVDAGVAIEVKTMSQPNKNKVSQYVLTNASIYPDVIKASDVLSKEQLNNIDKDLLLDVLIVFIMRYDDKLVDYRIVDGSYYGVEYSDFVGCREFFSILRDNLPDIIANMKNRYPNNSFIRKYSENKFNNKIQLDLRKLIKIENPAFTNDGEIEKEIKVEVV